VTGDNQDEIKAAGAWAKATYEAIVSRYGLKYEQYQKNGGDGAPMCAIHHVPMKLVDGKRGPFYSCHERDSEGNWCSYRPKEHAV